MIRCNSTCDVSEGEQEKMRVNEVDFFPNSQLWAQQGAVLRLLLVDPLLLLLLCKVRFCFGSGQPQQPSATRFWSWLVFLSPVLCVLSARPACTNQSLRLRVFLEILLRNRSAQIVGCVVVFFCLKENITDFVFVLLFK